MGRLLLFGIILLITFVIWIAKKNRHRSESDSMDKFEESLYEQAAMEVASKTMRPALAAKAFAEADGDEQKSMARYIKLRVPQLRDEFKDEIRRRAQRESETRRSE